MTNGDAQSALRPASPLGRLWGRALAATVGLAVLGWVPTQALAGSGGLPVMFMALGISLLGSLLGTWVTLQFPRRHPADLVSAVLGGLGVRFAVTLLPVAALVLADAVPAAVLLIWTGLGKFTLLGLDVFGLLQALGGSGADPRAKLAGAVQ